MENTGKYYTMFLGLLVLITALTISGIAIYYSVAGLVAIFAAAAVPIIIMGGALEIGKLVTAVWLHRYWKQATWWLKTYLTIAVLVLMFITSMGIFGFLSKAHIEQTAQSTENVAQIENIQKQIATQQAIIVRAEESIDKIQNSGTGADQNIQAQIDKENKRIDTAYDRVQPAIDETQSQLAEDTTLYTNQINAIDVQLEQLSTLSSIDTKDRDAVKLLQQLVGARPDGAYGSGTARAVKEYKQGLEADKQALYVKIEQLKNTANEEIKRLRSRAEKEIDDSNKLIERLRSQLGQDTGTDIQAEIDEQTSRIKTANAELDTLTKTKFEIESEYRKLEAEVGPIKYIAEFVYGEEADKTILEEAVRWVILIIIFVFDPLAVLLLIASQYTFEWRNTRKDDDGERLRREYEQARAQRIVDNPGYNIDDPKEDTDENSREEDSKEESENAEELRDGEPEERVQTETGHDPVVAEAEFQESPIVDEDAKREIANSYIPVEKKDLKSSEESGRLSEEELDALDSNIEWKTAKHQWKQDNPTETIKEFKDYYLNGKIDKLPWEDYLPEGVDLKKKETVHNEGKHLNHHFEQFGLI